MSFIFKRIVKKTCNTFAVGAISSAIVFSNFNAVASGIPTVAEYEGKKQKNYNIRMPNLHEMAFKDDIKSGLKLIENGADVDKLNGKGYSPIHIAAKTGALKFIYLLLDNGADIDQQDKLGRTSLVNAIERGNFNAAAILLDAGADTEIKDRKKETALWKAVKNKDIKSVELLMSFQADPYAKNIDGVTPYYLAKFNKLDDILANFQNSQKEDNVVLERRAPVENIEYISMEGGNFDKEFGYNSGNDFVQNWSEDINNYNDVQAPQYQQQVSPNNYQQQIYQAPQYQARQNNGNIYYGNQPYQGNQPTSNIYPTQAPVIQAPAATPNFYNTPNALDYRDLSNVKFDPNYRRKKQKRIKFSGESLNKKTQQKAIEYTPPKKVVKAPKETLEISIGEPISQHSLNNKGDLIENNVKVEEELTFDETLEKQKTEELKLRLANEIKQKEATIADLEQEIDRKKESVNTIIKNAEAKKLVILQEIEDAKKKEEDLSSRIDEIEKNIKKTAKLTTEKILKEKLLELEESSNESKKGLELEKRNIEEQFLNKVREIKKDLDKKRKKRDELVKEIGLLQKKRDALNEQIANAKLRKISLLKEMEGVKNRVREEALKIAQKTVDKKIKEANEKKEQILKNAKLEAEKILKDASKKASESEAMMKKAKEEYASILKQAEEVEQTEKAITSHLFIGNRKKILEAVLSPKPEFQDKEKGNYSDRLVLTDDYLLKANPSYKDKREILLDIVFPETNEIYDYNQDNVEKKLEEHTKIVSFEKKHFIPIRFKEDNQKKKRRNSFSLFSFMKDSEYNLEKEMIEGTVNVANKIKRGNNNQNNNF